MSQREVNFGKASTNGNAEHIARDSDDAPGKGVEEIHQELQKTNEELREERLARKELEQEVNELREDIRTLQEENSDDSTEPDVVEIEWKARNQDYGEMTSNVERAVKIWEEYPNYGSGSPAGDKLVLTYEQIKTAISVIDSRPKRNINSETVRRVRAKIEEMSDGLVTVKEREGKDGRKKHRMVTHVEDWAEQREDVVVRNLLPKKVAKVLLGGGQ